MSSECRYCRDIEAYLCRKNDGHLIRIVGPAFEQVSGWAEQGIPFNVACAGIDRYFERYYRKGPRRRPVRIEFCEADVLDAFDDWRRAVGVARATAASSPDGAVDAGDDAPARPRVSLASHMERIVARLTALASSVPAELGLQHVLESTAREIDAIRADARTARGAGRQALLSHLETLDRGMMVAIAATLDDRARNAAEEGARESLAPFRDRMTPEAYQSARRAAFERHVRDELGLPTLTFD